MHRSCAFPEPSVGITLFDSKAAFPPASWDLIWAVLDRAGVPAWLAVGLKALYFGSVVTIVFSSHSSANSFPV